MTNSVRTVLVLLRLAIGWHLLVEGYVKLHSLATGPTETSRPFSSRYYLQQSVGPFRDFFLWIAGGDPDEVLLAQLAVDSDAQPPRLSNQLRQYHQQYLENFARTFQVDQPTILQMQQKLQEYEQVVANWLTSGEEEWTRPTDWGPIRKKQKVTAWVAEYRQLVAELQNLLYRERRYFERPVGRERAERLRAELIWYREQLGNALRERTSGLLRTWYQLLPEDKRTASHTAVAEPTLEPTWLGFPLLWWADRTTAWGLTLAGGLLLFGLLSRLAAWVGFVLISLFYLCQPPLPWVPLPERAEGYYLYVNKNVIEALALALLGLVPTGRWFGLDGVLWAILRGRSLQTEALRTAQAGSASSQNPVSASPSSSAPEGRPC
ncbi:MAG: hypothetical protein RMJ19_05895 [Gemmatales bacterium]|nr:hypothetical protein [Gemmatales bacterium]MCS7159985.1 hypothetical protein [Gemmatales bacterium]MDW8175184.1 hypothetical protein [Gemmatales bacterium]MDW8223431.1 hypothetical protein [Gemmatales bacterium]